VTQSIDSQNFSLYFAHNTVQILYSELKIVGAKSLVEPDNLVVENFVEAGKNFVEARSIVNTVRDSVEVGKNLVETKSIVEMRDFEVESFETENFEIKNFEIGNFK
ncbi:19685_t:CDS:1, partial [Racocetra persica]